jgi:hypothetical protein
MPFSGMSHRVPLVRTEVSEEHGASTIRVTRIGELGKTLAITNCRLTHSISSKRGSVASYC